MPDDILPIGSITITIGMDQEGTDIVAAELDNEVSVMQALGALQVVQRDLLNSITVTDEPDNE